MHATWQTQAIQITADEKIADIDRAIEVGNGHRLRKEKQQWALVERQEFDSE